MVILSGIKYRRVNKVKRNKKINDWKLLLFISWKLKRDELIIAFLTTIFSFTPKTLEKTVISNINVSSKPIDFSLIPLSLEFITILIKYFSSTIFLPIDELTFIKMPIKYDLNPFPIFFHFTVFIQANIPKICISCIIIYGCFCDCWQQWKNETISIFFNMK